MTNYSVWLTLDMDHEKLKDLDVGVICQSLAALVGVGQFDHDPEEGSVNGAWFDLSQKDAVTMVSQLAKLAGVYELRMEADS
jgi:hypothetical protein